MENTLIAAIISAISVALITAYIIRSIFILRPLNHLQLTASVFLVVILSAISGINYVKYDVKRNGGGTTRELLEAKMGNVKYSGATTFRLPVTVVLDRGKLHKWSFEVSKN